METIWAAVIGAVTGAVLTGGIAAITATWILGRTIGGLRDAVERHRHVLENGLTAKVEDNRVEIAGIREHQRGQDSILGQIRDDLRMITDRLETLLGQGWTGCD